MKGEKGRMRDPPFVKLEELNFLRLKIRIMLC